MDELVLFKNLPISASLLTKDGVRIDVNKAFGDFFKYSREGAIGVPLEKLYRKEDVPIIKEALERCKTEDYSECEATLIRGDGTEMPIVLNFSVVRDDAGNITNIIGTATDITKLRKKEEELEKTQRFAQELFKKAPTPMSLLDPDGNRIDVNDAFEKVYGYSREEILGVPTERIYTKESIPVVKETNARARDEGYAKTEVIAKRKDGSTFPVVVQGSAIKDEDGYTTHLIFVVTDISDLESERSRLIQIMKALPVGVVLTSYSKKPEERKWTYVNPVLEEITGYSRDEIIGKSIVELPFVVSQREEIEKGFGKGYEMRIKSRSGKDVVLRTSFGTVNDLEGRPRDAVISLTDITDLKRANEFNEEVLKLAPAAFCLVDKDGRWHLMNDKWNKAWGWDDAEINGKKAEDQPCVTEESLNALKKLWRYVVDEKKEANEGIVVPYKHKNGHTVYIRTWEAPLMEGEGRIAIGIDVTEEFEREKELKHANEFNEMLLARVN